MALARKVQELNQIRSDFFGKLRAALGARQDFKIVGDRFVFPSDVLFDPGSAALKPSAYGQLDKLSTALKEIRGNIPPDIAWVMRVDGHTDINPIATAEFPSNWELSSAPAVNGRERRPYPCVRQGASRGAGDASAIGVAKRGLCAPRVPSTGARRG